MNNISHKKNWNIGTVQVYMDLPQSTMIKSKNYDKPDKYFVRIKLRRDPTSENSDLYELKMALFDNVRLKEFLLLIRNFNMTLKASGTLMTGANNQYLHMLVRREVLLQFDTFSAEIGSDTPENFISIILGLVTYLPLY